MKKIIAVISIIAIICCLCSAVSAAEGESEDVDISTSSVNMTQETSTDSAEAVPDTEPEPPGTTEIIAHDTEPEPSGTTEVIAHDTEPETPGTTEVVAPDTEPEPPGTTEVVAPDTEPEPPGTTEGVDPDVEQGATNDETWGEWLLRIIYENATKILAGLSAIICSLAFISQKTTLFPAISSFIGNTQSSVRKISKDIEEWKNDIHTEIEEWKNGIHAEIEEWENKNAIKIDSIKGEGQNIKTNAMQMKGTVEEVLKEVKVSTDQVLVLQKQQGVAQYDRKILKSFLANQSEMLNIVIQASTLSQWRKDKIGQMHEDNKKLIEEMTEHFATSEDGVASE